MNRWVLTFVVVLVLLLILAMSGKRYWEVVEMAPSPMFLLESASSEPVELQPCMDASTREKIRGIMYEGIDEALKEHIMKMYDVWMKDDRGQPGRAATGVRQGIKAYLGARMGVDKWDPPPCAN